MSHCLNAAKGCVLWPHGALKGCACCCEVCLPSCCCEVCLPSVTWRRGEVDGRNGHPPAEISAEYMRGYAQGLENKP